MLTEAESLWARGFARGAYSAGVLSAYPTTPRNVREERKMKSLDKTIVTAAVLAGAALLGMAPAEAGVHIGIGIGIPGVAVGVRGPAYYYGPGYYPPGPCDGYNYYYAGDCGYAVYNGAVLVDGVWVNGPHYYRWWGGQPWFWYRGGWSTWDGWTSVNFGW